MKIKNFTTIGIGIAFLATVLSCNKERLEPNTDPNPDLRAQSIEKIVDNANNKYLSVEISSVNETRPFLLVNDGLIDEYLAKNQFLFPENNNPGNKLIACLMAVGLNQPQIPHVRRAMQGFEERNLMIISKHREAVEILKARVEARRLELNQQLANGQISQVEYQRFMHQLREHFTIALKKIKEAHAQAFSKSYRMLMQQLSNILTPTQWDGFKTCLLSN